MADPTQLDADMAKQLLMNLAKIKTAMKDASKSIEELEAAAKKKDVKQLLAKRNSLVQAHSTIVGNFDTVHKALNKVS